MYAQIFRAQPLSMVGMGAVFRTSDEIKVVPELQKTLTMKSWLGKPYCVVPMVGLLMSDISTNRCALFLVIRR